ncbi:MAG: hypothetical protein WD397_12875 [Wenzhouxiangellaceae bacterium]
MADIHPYPRIAGAGRLLRVPGLLDQVCNNRPVGGTIGHAPGAATGASAASESWMGRSAFQTTSTRRFPKPTLFTTPSTATPPGPAPGAFHSVAHPHRTGECVSGALGRETPHLQDLSTPRDERVVNKAGEEVIESFYGSR